MNIIKIKNNFSLEKVKKSADIVIVDSVKVDPNEFPDKYIKNIKICNITCQVKKKIFTNIKFYNCKRQLNFSDKLIKSYDVSSVIVIQEILFLYLSTVVDIEILTTKNSRRTHFNHVKCKAVGIVCSDIRSIDEPNLSVLYLKILKYN